MAIADNFEDIAKKLNQLKKEPVGASKCTCTDLSEPCAYCLSLPVSGKAKPYCICNGTGFITPRGFGTQPCPNCNTAPTTANLKAKYPHLTPPKAPKQKPICSTCHDTQLMPTANGMIEDCPICVGLPSISVSGTWKQVEPEPDQSNWTVEQIADYYSSLQDLWTFLQMKENSGTLTKSETEMRRTVAGKISDRNAIEYLWAEIHPSTVTGRIPCKYYRSIAYIKFSKPIR